VTLFLSPPCGSPPLLSFSFSFRREREESPSFPFFSGVKKRGRKGRLTNPFPPLFPFPVVRWGSENALLFFFPQVFPSPALGGKEERLKEKSSSPPPLPFSDSRIGRFFFSQRSSFLAGEGNRRKRTISLLIFWVERVKGKEPATYLAVGYIEGQILLCPSFPLSLWVFFLFLLGGG